MTDKDKPEQPATPGMAEVSAKFVHEAEAAVAATASTNEALSALWQEHERLTAQYEETTRQYAAAEIAQQAIAETETPEYDAAATAAEDAGQWQQETSDAVVAVENRMAKVPARTVTGALLKLRIAGADITGEHRDRYGVLNESQMNSVERLTLSALTDLERLVGEAAPIGAASAIEDPVLVLKRKWEARWGEYVGAPDNSDETTDPLHDRVNETAYEIFQTPATTLAGVAFKLVLWARQHVKHGYEGVAGWSRPPVESYSPDLDHLPVVSALHDLERMSSGTIAPEAPPAEDTALFDAIAEYDRLATIEQELEHRAEIFRPGIPEAEEADKAYKAAREEASRAWGKACGIPATTQAGLFAKLQAIIQFLGDIEENDLHEDEWNIVKADVRRIAGEARS